MTENLGEKMRQLCKLYGFRELGCPDNPNLEIWQLSIIEQLDQIAHLYQLYKLCEGNPITIESTIAKPHNGMIKGSRYNVDISIKWIKEILFQTLDSMTQHVCMLFEDVLYNRNINIDNLKLEDIDTIINIATKLKKMYKSTNNAKIGWHITKDLKFFNNNDYFPISCSKTKIYSFLYDRCVIIGLANNIGEGFSGSIGKEKYTQVRNWITAFDKQIKDEDMSDLLNSL